MRLPPITIRTIFPFPLALGSILALWVFLAAFGGVADPDIWWHLRNAEYLFLHGELPRFDLYSYTTLGDPWVNHEWLAEVPYYLAWRTFGLRGIYLFFLLLIELILLGGFYWSYKISGNLKGSFLVSCFSVYLAVVSFGPRTLLFGWAYLVILLLVLSRFRATGQGPLWVLPLLFCLWINSHGSWLIGMIVFGIVVAAGLVEGNWGRVEAVRWSPTQLRKLLLAGGASVGALFVNPFGHRLVLYPFDLVFRQKLNVTYVQEWLSVDFHTPRGKVVFVVLLAFILGALLSRSRWRLEELALSLLALYAGLTYMRFLFLVAILLAPVLAKFLDFLPPYKPEIDKPVFNALIVAGILWAVVARFPSEADLESGVAKQFPVGTLTYLKTHELDGHIFNLYMWGGYISWHHPEIKTFIDSRTDIFEYRGVLQDYLDTVSLKKSLEILDKYQVRYVLLPPQEPLSYLLRHQGNWKAVFEDTVSAVFERVGPMTEPESASSRAQTGRSP